MEQNDKYGIVIEAITSKFKSGIKELVQVVKNFGKEAEEETTITPKFVDTGYQKQIDYVKAQMQEIQDILDVHKMGELPLDDKEVLKLEADYESLSYKLEDLVENQKEFNGELEETDNEAKKTKSTLSTLFDNSIGKIKRFTYYLLGARSVFSLFMRYRSAYYQFNEKMQYQSELSQNAIALSLAPAFEFLGNVVAYASIGLAKFIELLTGANVLSKVTTKGIKNYNKSLKETQTLVSGIDEITNLTNPQNLGLADQYKALDDFRKKIEEVEEFFKKNEWIQALADGLKAIWNFVKEKLLPAFKTFFDSIGGVEGALILLGGIKVMSALGTLIGKVGIGATAGTGLAGIVGLLTFIAGTHIITLALKTSTELGELQEMRPTQSTETHEKLKLKLQEVINKLKTQKKGSQEYNKTLKEADNLWKYILDDIEDGNEKILENKDEVKDLASELDKITDKSTYTNTFNIAEAIGLNTLEDKARSGLDVLEDGLLGTEKEIELRKKAYLELIDEVQTGQENAVDKVKDKLGDIETKVKNIMKKEYKLKINAEVVASVGKSATEGAKALSEAVVKAIRGYAKGLDYVPYDNYPALLHKGEAVVPAKYNPTIHSQGNEYTNSLLETLVLKIDDLSQRPNVFEIDGQQFANATYNLYDNERKRQGYVEGVVR